MFSAARLLACAVLLAAGCRLNGPVIGQTAGSIPTREPVIASEVTLEVISKRDPDTLIASDGSTCRVAPDVYGRTRLGSMFRCRWLRT
jgi:hypothetical protein